jgi:hypothetical protein
VAEDIPEYDELKLTIAPDPAGGFHVAALAPGGVEADGTFELPLDEKDLELFILRLGHARGGVRVYRSPQMEQAKEFGSKLYDALFRSTVDELYRQAVNRAQGEQAAHGRGELGDVLLAIAMLVRDAHARSQLRLVHIQRRRAVDDPLHPAPSRQWHRPDRRPGASRTSESAAPQGRDKLAGWPLCAAQRRRFPVERLLRILVPISNRG